MSVDTLASLNLSLTEAENQRTTKHPQMSGLEVTRCVKAIKKIRERKLHRLEAMVGVPITSGPWTTPTSKPFDLMLLSMSGYTRDSSLTYNGYYNTLIQPQLNKLRVFAYAYG